MRRRVPNRAVSCRPPLEPCPGHSEKPPRGETGHDAPRETTPVGSPPMGEAKDPSLLPFPALYARMREGDGAAWSEFHARYEPLLRHMARRWLNPELRRQADSADMTQSVLRALLQSDGRVAFEDEGRLRAWLA